MCSRAWRANRIVRKACLLLELVRVRVDAVQEFLREPARQALEHSVDVSTTLEAFACPGDFTRAPILRLGVHGLNQRHRGALIEPAGEMFLILPVTSLVSGMRPS